MWEWTYTPMHPNFGH